MKRGRVWVALCAVALDALAFGAEGGKAGGVFWTDGRELPLESKGFSKTPGPFGRLPVDMLGRFSPRVRRGAERSTGHYVVFSTESERLAVEWKVREKVLDGAFDSLHRNFGIDIYVKDARGWRFVKGGHPTPEAGVDCVTAELPKGPKDVMIYLPTSAVVASFRVGLDRKAGWTRYVHPSGLAKPIVHYGTSIVAGGSASRPGLTFANRTARLVDAPYVNLGFGGAALLEPELAEAMTRIDASLYIVDPAWNCGPRMILDRCERFLRILHAARPETPILLCEGGEPYGFRHDPNDYLLQVYEKLKAENSTLSRQLHYLPAKGLLTPDGESVTDECHPNDCGTKQMAEAYAKKIREILR